MPGSSSPSPSPSPDRPSKTSNAKRKNNGSLTPLQTISESQLVPPPPIPVKSNLRTASSSDVHLPPIAVQPHNTNWFDSRDASTETGRTAPPAYEYVPAPGQTDNEYLDNGPVEGEKLAALREKGGFRRRDRRGWLWIGAAIAALCIIGLAIGLGVGLTVGRHNSNDDASSGSGAPAGSDNGTASLPFPIGSYSIVTALRTVDTNCTSNPATWRCFPYATYDPSVPTTAESSQTSFNWIITNTSSTYATNMTGSTPDEGVPANLTISSTDNPFGITFPATNVTYISSMNSSSARYVFSLVQSKGVFPSSTITTDNSVAECFFNQTTFSGTLYLSAERTYPNSTQPDTKDANQWPFAAEVAQTSPGGSDVPACYEYTDGAVGARITDFLTPLTAQTSQCTCDYRNY